MLVLSTKAIAFHVSIQQQRSQKAKGLLPELLYDFRTGDEPNRCHADTAKSKLILPTITYCMLGFA